VDTPLGSRYVLHDVLGRGAMGQVFRGSVRGSGAAVAVKVLKPELVSDTEVVARFFRERSILTSIDHPNVAQVLDLVVEGETLGIVMELVDGQDLRRYLRARGTLPPAEAVYLAGQLLQGLAAVHAGGVVHRDVKPENVLVSMARGQMTLKLTDFGVSRLSYGASLTKMTSLIGTPEYMAPELAEHDTATPAADLYSAGIVLYEMLAGRTPFAGGHPLAVLRRHVEQPPPPVPGVPGELWEQIESLLAKDPRSRPGSAAAALGRLAPLQNRLDGRPALPPMPGQPAPVPGQTMPGRGYGQTTPGREYGQTTPGQGYGQITPGREPGQTVLRARDRGLAPAGENEPPPGVSSRAGRGPAGARRRRRAAIISLPAVLVILAAAVGWLLTHSPHGASPVADSQTTPTSHASLSVQRTPPKTATRSAPQAQPTSLAASPEAESAPSVTPQANPVSSPPSTTGPPAGGLNPACGTVCIALYSPFYADSEVLGVVGGKQSKGQPIDLQSVSATNGAEDWVIAFNGPVSSFYDAGLVSAAIDRQYPSNTADEYQYAPFGVDTGLCLGVSGTAQNGTPVSLQPCGVSAATVWVSDAADQNGSQVPLINATTTNFTQPLVLTANGGGVNVTTSSLTSGAGSGQYWSTER
jgi:serine/threonine protein kinase, bacterial